jgi:hypothetical protein
MEFLKQLAAAAVEAARTHARETVPQLPVPGSRARPLTGEPAARRAPPAPDAGARAR